MTTRDPSRDRLTRAFSSVAQTLESTDDAEQRIVRSLELLRELVPYRSCALYATAWRSPGQLYLVPPLAEGAEREALARHLLSALRTVSGVDTAASSERRPHLTLPVVGLDRVIGVLRVEPPEKVAYDAGHASLLSIVAAQLGAYLTGLKLQEDQARRLRDLEAAHDFQRLLVAVVGHDLRNPLSVINSGAVVLEHGLVGVDDQREMAGRIKRNVRRAAKIIDDLLDLTQIQLAGGLRLHRIPTDLVPLVSELVNDTRAAEPTRPITFESSAPVVIVECDPDRVMQVVTNLLGNALRHGSVEHDVQVRLTADDTRAQLSVHNRGAPISPELLPIIFDPFQRGAGRAKRERESLGLGLYIVREIVRSHGGQIAVSSDEHETVFRMSLPRTMKSEERAPFSGSPIAGAPRIA